MKRIKIRNGALSFASLPIDSLFHIGINKHTRQIDIDARGLYAYNIWRKTSLSKAVIVDTVGFGNKRSIGQSKSFSPTTPVYITFPVINPTKYIIVNQKYRKVIDEEFTDERAAQLVADQFNSRVRRKEDMVFTMGKTY
jgi:hypothetical protein